MGHMSREAEVMKAVKEIRPDIPLGLKTPTAEWFVWENMPGGTIYEQSSIDVGVVQRDSLRLDEEATLEEYNKIISRKEDIISEEVQWAETQGVKLIVSDIPPLAFDIAEALGIPSICIANFSWDWIYQPYVQQYPQFEHILEDIRKSQSKCTLLLEVPFEGDLSSFPNKQRIPLIGRKSSLSKHDARKILGIPPDKKVLLLTFGGFGVEKNDGWETDFDDDTIVITTRADMMCQGWRYLPVEEMRKLDLKYPDLVRACDAVLTKPGYGIVVECIANGTPIIHVERGVFPEYEILVGRMGGYIPEIFMETNDFLAGRWKKYLDEILSDDTQREKISVEGASAAAEIILDYYR